MHQLFTIRELVDEILQPFRKDLTSLSRIARTCKAFEDPSLDMLWYSQYAITPLILVMANFKLCKRYGDEIWRDTTSEEGESQLRPMKSLYTPRCLGPPSKADLVRLHRYASRIQIFSARPRKSSSSLNIIEVDADILHLFTHYLGDNPFPHLHKIIWPIDGISASRYSSIQHLFSSQLVSVTLTFPEHYLWKDPRNILEVTAEMFDVLARRSDATLETLHIQTIEALPHAAFSAIQRMTYLRVVELPTHHDYTFWFSLALLPNLRIIKCQVVLDPLILPSSLDDIPSINKPFPSLTTLTIRCGLVECTWLLSFYKLQTVSSLSMSLQEPMDISLTISETRLDFFRTNATSLSNIFTVITQQLSENLKSLDLQFRRGLLCGDDESKFLDPPTITHQIIENLTSSFPNITRFTLDHGWKFNFDDADASLHLLGRSWPQLT
ncbi:hypothetical protein ABKN59_010847 [Abortiporus biennis]